MGLNVAVAAAFTFKNWPYEVELPPGTSYIDGPFPGRKALQFEGRAPVELPNVDSFSADKPFTVAAWIKVPKGEESYVIASQTDPDSRFRGWALELNTRRPTLRVSALNRTYSIRTGIDDRLTAGKWYHIAFTYDGSRDARGFALYVDGKPVLMEGRSDQPNLRGEFRTYAPLRIASDGRRKTFSGGAIADLRLITRALREEEIRVTRLWPIIDSARGKDMDAMSTEERDALSLYFVNREYGDFLSAGEGTATTVQTEGA